MKTLRITRLLRAPLFSLFCSLFIASLASCTAIVDKTLVELGPDCEGVQNGEACPGIDEDDLRICLNGSCVESVCGDGFVDPRFEDCDDDGPGCSSCRYLCKTDEDCDDGEDCNGKESCNSNHLCVVGSLAPPGSVCELSDGRQGVCDSSFVCDLCRSVQNVGESCGEGLICRDQECAESVCGDGIVDPSSGESCDEDHPGCVDCVWECESDHDCDDGEICNGEERCVDHQCAPGTPAERGEACALFDLALGVCETIDGDALCVEPCGISGDCSVARCDGSEECVCESGACYPGCDVAPAGAKCAVEGVGPGVCDATGTCQTF